MEKNNIPKCRFTHVTFSRFKAFESFSFPLRHFNILVGPNNAGKSTVLAAFRILSAACRRAANRSPVLLRGPNGQTWGHKIDLTAASVAEENIFFNYDDSRAATVKFRLSNGNELLLYFPEQETCYLIPEASAQSIQTAAVFRKHFNCPIGFVPILGPVEHHEPLYEKEAARLALYNYRAARNFRNIWYHYPEQFEQFRSLLRQTWPGMDVQPPVVDRSYKKALLHMFCPEERIPREIFWAGFGFQVWCQMLTHLIQSSKSSLFLIDEPDIYLHSDLQRQLLGLLRNLGPDVLLATHSTEIVTEAETDDIVLINKKRAKAKRIKNPSQLEDVFRALGSNLNPILTQLAKTRRAVFVEGKDFQIIGKFARKLKSNKVANRSNFAVIPIEGFNPEKIKNLKSGMETTLGSSILAAAVLDRDYRSDSERKVIQTECRTFCDHVSIHERKEIENFLLIPPAINRAAAHRVADRSERGGKAQKYAMDAEELLEEFATKRKSYVTAQLLANRRQFERSHAPGLHEATINESALLEFESAWQTLESRLQVVPGKEAFSYVNQRFQQEYSISVTVTGVIDAMTAAEVPTEMKTLIDNLTEFATKIP